MRDTRIPRRKTSLHVESTSCNHFASQSVEDEFRAWYSHRQGLDGSLSGAAPEEVLAQTGWIRSVGSSTPYLALFARAGISRVAADAAVAKLPIHELPSARGCTYILPQRDFTLGLM